MALGKIVTVYPLMPNSGSKYMSLEMAYRYKDLHPTHKVAVIDLNLIRPYLGYGILERYDTSSRNLDSFMMELSVNEYLTRESILKLFAEPKNGIFVLTGSKEYLQRRHIKTEHIQFLLDNVKEMFDIVFISVATDIDNPGTIVSFYNSWKVVVVGKHNISTFEGFMNGINKIKPYVNLNNVKFIYNFYDESLDFHFGDYIILYNIEVLGFMYLDTKTKDSIHLSKKGAVKKSFFGGRLKNDRMISEIVKNLLKK